MAEICYKKNFIKQVVARIDFAQPLSNLTPESLTAAVTKIKKRFPISEQITGFHQGVELSATQIKTSKEEYPEWRFHGLDRDKFVIINQHFISVVLSRYKSELDFQSDVTTPILEFINSRTPTVISRTGVRFINVFDFEIKSFKAVKAYFSNGIADSIALMQKPRTCVRSILLNEFLEDDIKLRMQSGFFNPDYPSTITKHQFVIDIDAYIDFPHQFNDVEAYLGKFHDNIQNLFEMQITQKLRDEVLNG